MIFYLILSLFMLTYSTIPIELGKSFELIQGDKATSKEANFEFSVTKISDSRCPEGTNCIWAGELAVEIEYEYNKGTKTSTLVVPAIGKLNQRSILALPGGYELRFEGDVPRSSYLQYKGSEKSDKPLKFRLIRLE